MMIIRVGTANRPDDMHNEYKEMLHIEIKGKCTYLDIVDIVWCFQYQMRLGQKISSTHLLTQLNAKAEWEIS